MVTSEECKSIKELFSTKFEALEKRMDEKFETFDKRTDRMIESQNGKNRILDNRITKIDDKHQKQADNHCPRIREIESNIGKMDIQKEVSDLKTKVKVNALKIASAGGAIVLFVTLAFDKVADWLNHLITK